MWQLVIGAILINNLVLAKFLGLCPFFGVSRKLSSALYMGIAVILVMFMSTLLTTAIDQYVLTPFGVGYLRIFSFILIIAAVVQVLDGLIHHLSPKLYESVGVYLPLIGTNCAIFGMSLIAVGENMYTGERFGFLEAAVWAIASGVGFTLVLVIMAGIREHLEFARLPAAFKGLPAAFLSAGLIALAFSGFAGFNLIAAGH